MKSKKSPPPDKRPCDGRTPYARCRTNCPLSHEHWEEGEMTLLDGIISGQYSIPKEYFIHKVYTHSSTFISHRESVSHQEIFGPIYDEVFTQLLAERIQELSNRDPGMGPCERDFIEGYVL